MAEWFIDRCNITHKGGLRPNFRLGKPSNLCIYEWTPGFFQEIRYLICSLRNILRLPTRKKPLQIEIFQHTNATWMAPSTVRAQSAASLPNQLRIFLRMKTAEPLRYSSHTATKAARAGTCALMTAPRDIHPRAIAAPKTVPTVTCAHVW